LCGSDHEPFTLRFSQCEDRSCCLLGVRHGLPHCSSVFAQMVCA
jgi:hypothetical protein